MLKRLTALILSLLLLLAMLPTAVFAEEVIPYELYVGGVQVTSTNTKGDGWLYKGDANSGTLTLKNANISGICNRESNDQSIYSKGIDLKIILEGTNKLTPEGTKSNGIYVRGNLTIEGSGSLEITASKYGIFDRGTLTLNNADITIDSTDDGIHAEENKDGDIFSINGGNIQINNSNEQGISCYGLQIAGTNLTINKSRLQGIDADYASFTNSIILVHSLTEYSIYTNKNIDFTNSEVTFISDSANAIYCYGGVVSVTDSKLTAESNSTAIEANAIKILSEGGSISPYVEATSKRKIDPAVIANSENSIEISDDLTIAEPEGGKVGQQPDSSKCTIIDAKGAASTDVIIKQTLFNVKLAETKNGTAAVSAEKAAQGDEITVKAEPDKGYELDTITYTDASKKAVDITKAGKFEMPNSNVTVAVTFKEVKKEVTPTPTPTPAVTPTPAAEKTYDQIMATMTAKGKKALTLKWNKIAGAEGYDIFFAKCNSNKKKEVCKLVKTVSAGKSFWTKNKLKAKTAYKAYVRAFVMKDGAKTYISKSPDAHAYTSGGNAKYTNPKSVSVKKKNVTLKAGKTFKIKATVKKLKNSKKLISKGHAAKLRYISSDPGVATVTKKGKIKAVKAGTCKIYVYAVNGTSKTVKVTVK